MKNLQNIKLWPEYCPFLGMCNRKATGIAVLITGFIFTACSDTKQSAPQPRQETVRAATSPGKDDSVNKKPTLVFSPEGKIETGTTNPAELLDYSKTLIGTPYLYASTDPAKGFDCSGFITHVFNHFNISVPRSSVDFTNYGMPVSLEEAQSGDLILFTGTDSIIRVVGHMGIVESVKNDTLYFIHSTSGKMKGVVITPFGNYYRSRFVKVIRVFPGKFFE